MQLKIVETSKPKAIVALQGASGSGKSYSALMLAYGLCGAFNKVAVIETDYKTTNHYSYLGPYNTLALFSPFTPEKFSDAIELCERSGMEVIIIDTLSSEWAGIGGMVERIEEEGTDCLHWHSSLLKCIQNSKCHIIATLQSKEGYHLSIKGGRREVQKVGLEPIQEENIHYHFHTVLCLDMKHRATPLKDRTSFFEEHSGMVITEEIAVLFARWCNIDRRNVTKDLQLRINDCKSIKELLELMFQSDVEDDAISQAFMKRRIELEHKLEENPIFSLNKHFDNGNFNHRA